MLLLISYLISIAGLVCGQNSSSGVTPNITALSNNNDVWAFDASLAAFISGVSHTASTTESGHPFIIGAPVIIFVTPIDNTAGATTADDLYPSGLLFSVINMDSLLVYRTNLEADRATVDYQEVGFFTPEYQRQTVSWAPQLTLPRAIHLLRAARVSGAIMGGSYTGRNVHTPRTAQFWKFRVRGDASRSDLDCKVFFGRGNVACDPTSPRTGETSSWTGLL